MKVTPPPRELEDFLQSVPAVEYYIFSLEKGGNTGAFHYQGYLYLKNPHSLSSLNLWFDRLFVKPGHYELAKGTPEQNRAYCDKSDVSSKHHASGGHTFVSGPYEWGTLPQQGKRTDINDAIASMMTDGIRGSVSEHGSVWVRYYQGLQFVRNALTPLPRDTSFVPRLWQQEVINWVEQEPNDREIIWICDPDGFAGKSRLSRYLQFEKNAVLLSGRLQDMAKLYEKEPIVLFDISRSSSEFTSHYYAMAEQLKNGIIVSTKYMVERKIFDPPHVVFFSNSWPDKTKWTKDRYCAFLLKAGVLSTMLYEDIPDPQASIVDATGARSVHFRRS